MMRWAAGWIMRSSVVTRYQLGLVRQAGSVTGPPQGLQAPGDLRVGHEPATSAANEA
jgi:hypothetical protein